MQKWRWPLEREGISNIGWQQWNGPNLGWNDMHVAYVNRRGFTGANDKNKGIVLEKRSVYKQRGPNACSHQDIITV